MNIILDFQKHLVIIIRKGGIMKRYLILIMIFTVLVFAGSQDVFRFAVVGDRTGSHVPGIFPEIIDEVKLLDPDFVMCVGDLIEGYKDDTWRIHAEWDTIMDIVGTLSCPFYFVAGNHDIQNEIDRMIYEKRTGFKRYYSFDYKNSHFIILDNTMTYWPIPQEVDEEQIAWLKKDLEKNKNKDNIFVFYHLPTYLYALENNTTDVFVEIFEQYGVDIVFTGHHHEYSYLNRNGIEYINVGSSGGGMGTNDFARGHFYHYLMVTVRKKNNNIAIIKKGNIFLRNIVTADDLLLIDKADEDAVTLTPCIVREESKKSSQYFTATIDNFGTDSIVQTLKWDFDPNHYTISPAATVLTIGSDEQREYKFNFTVHKGSHIFPIPHFTLAYPFTYGKICTLQNYLLITRLASVRKVKSPPVIDGILKDKVWKNPAITNLGTYDGQSSTSIEKTEMYFCHDDDNLYLAARCFESDFSAMEISATEHDGATYYDDNLWLFFDSNFDKQTYYQAIINSKGIVFDRLCSLINGESTKDLAWNGPWTVASGREDNAWILEIKIPKRELEPLNEKQWGFNFRRLQTRLNDAGYWSLPFDHDPNYFGIIEFE
jgi:predicted phosphodiesterase